jgi:hypothetical protein
MTTPNVPATSTPTIPPPDDERAAELEDAAKTADDAPAPMHPEREREVLVRDAYGHDPYGGDHYGPDGERDAVQLGQPPDEVPDPKAAAFRAAKAADPKP